jgi:hypothetical protein
MARSKKKRTVRVGDRVRIRIAALEIVADVVEDRGHIGVGGRHFVAVSFVGEDGEIEKMDWPAEEMTVLPRDPATT